MPLTDAEKIQVLDTAISKYDGDNFKWHFDEEPKIARKEEADIEEPLHIEDHTSIQSRYTATTWSYAYNPARSRGHEQYPT